MSKQQNWIFILGCNNSGTSLLHHLLSLHPEIDHLGVEGHSLILRWSEIKKATGIDYTRVFTECLQYLSPPKDSTLKREANPHHVKMTWLKNRVKHSGTHLMIKSPPDMVRSHWLQNNFKPSRFIGIVRNGYAVALSILNKGKSLPEGARHWNLANKIMMRDSPHLEHFHLITYEDLIENPRDTLKQIVTFLELPRFDYDFLDEYVPTKSVFRAVKSRKIYDGNKPYKITEEQKKTIFESAEEMLTYFNYNSLGDD